MMLTVARITKIAGLAGVFVCVSPSLFAAQAPVIDITSTGSRVRGGPSLDERVSKLESVLENQTLEEFSTRLESLQRDLQRLQGDAEVINHGIEDIKRKQRELYLDIDRRLRKLELQQSSVAPVDPNAQVLATAAQEERATYDLAFALLRDGKYDEAIPALEEFIKRYPTGDNSVNARYWLGEAYFVQRRYDVALPQFETIVTHHPTSPKYSDALLKIGLVQYELGAWDKSTQALKDVVSRFPNTTQA
jgi:tol-pal system protein YbgF